VLSSGHHIAYAIDLISRVLSALRFGGSDRRLPGMV
jgi:hypothetical protein